MRSFGSLISLHCQCRFLRSTIFRSYQTKRILQGFDYDAISKCTAVAYLLHDTTTTTTTWWKWPLFYRKWKTDNGLEYFEGKGEEWRKEERTKMVRTAIWCTMEETSFTHSQSSAVGQFAPTDTHILYEFAIDIYIHRVGVPKSVKLQITHQPGLDILC